MKKGENIWISFFVRDLFFLFCSDLVAILWRFCGESDSLQAEAFRRTTEPRREQSITATESSGKRRSLQATDQASGDGSSFRRRKLQAKKSMYNLSEFFADQNYTDRFVNFIFFYLNWIPDLVSFVEIKITPIVVLISFFSVVWFILYFVSQYSISRSNSSESIWIEV